MNDREILKVILISLYKDQGRLERGWHDKNMPDKVKEEHDKITQSIVWTEKLIVAINDYEEEWGAR